MTITRLAALQRRIARQAEVAPPARRLRLAQRTLPLLARALARRQHTPPPMPRRQIGGRR